MRRFVLAVLMILCLLLASCGAAENSVKDAMNFRSALCEHGGASFEADVFCEIGGRGYEFTLNCQCDADGIAQVSVLKPESVAGVKATMTDTDTVLEFDGISLDFGVPDQRLVSPLYAPLVFMNGWLGGYIDSAGEDDASTRVTYLLGSGDEEIILETWFLGGVPSACEIYCEETCVLSAAIGQFTFLSQ